jgi:hypothetical protein
MDQFVAILLAIASLIVALPDLPKAIDAIIETGQRGESTSVTRDRPTERQTALGFIAKTSNAKLCICNSGAGSGRQLRAGPNGSNVLLQ